jgi:hypothetical protein
MRGVNPFQIIDFNDRGGIWNSDQQLVKALGEDPAKQLRGHAEIDAVKQLGLAPAGLKNLGATCYLNSLLQYLFFNVDFRDGVLNASDSGSAALRELQRVFALLAGGDRATIDPGDFVRAARIDAVEQADATEFSALLLDWLERELNAAGENRQQCEGEATTAASGGAPRESGGAFIPSIFQGEVSQILRCMARPDHVFERRERFYELRARLSAEVQDAPWLAGQAWSGSGGAGTARCSSEAVVVPPVLPCSGAIGLEAATAVVGAPVGGATGASAPRVPKRAGGAASRKKPPPTVWLEQLLEDTAFPEEVLEGSNQYHCPKCDRKVDARKTTKPAKLPPYLHVTLERYHYDLKKFERRKLNHIVSFPRRLEFRLATPPAPLVPEQPNGEIAAADNDAAGQRPAQATENPADAVAASAAEGTARNAAEGTAALGAAEASGGTGVVAPGFRAAAATKAEGTKPVVYECIGYLEHVSDTAQSGHYTATLLQADADAKAALQAAHAASGSDASVGSAEPPSKRLCCAADAAAGVPSKRTWWKLDDDTVSPVTWAPVTALKADDGGSAAAAAGEAARGAPRRIESPSAYLLLYRRADYVSRTSAGAGAQSASEHSTACDKLPARFAALVASENNDLAQARSRYTERAALAECFAGERRTAINAMVKALKEAVVPPSGSLECGGAGLSIVPTAWLETFLRGGEFLQEEGALPRTRLASLSRAVEAPPPLYGRALRFGGKRKLDENPEEGGEGIAAENILDPLAVWCGQVKFVQTSALRTLFECCPSGGIDHSMFIDAEGTLQPEVCRKAWNIFGAWREEHKHIVRVLQGKLSAADVRAMQTQGRGGELTYISTRVLNRWKKTVSSCAVVGQSAQADSERLRAQWWAFLQEVKAARFGASAEILVEDAAAAQEGGPRRDEDAEPDAAADAAPARAGDAAGAADAAAGAVPRAEVLHLLESQRVVELVLAGGLVCPHGLLNRPRSGAAVLRADVVPLLEASRAKEQAYLEYWEEASVVPRVRTGLPDQSLLGIDQCMECLSSAATTSGAAAGGADHQQARSHRNIVVRQRYASGNVRKKGIISVPDDGSMPLTLASVKTLVLAKFGLSVARLWTQGSDGSEVEVDKSIDQKVELVIIEKDENAVAPEREAAAFESCIFRVT